MNLGIDNIPAVVLDHEKRIGNIEKTIQTLELRMDGIVTSMEELKVIMIQSHKESMETLRNVITHDQTMEKNRTDFKQEFQRMELTLKQKQLEMQEKHQEMQKIHAEEKEAWERKQQEEKEKFEREQRAENRKMTRDMIGKMVVWGTPIVTTIVTVINQVIEKYFQ